MMNFSVLGVALLKMVRNDVLTKKPTIPIWMKIVSKSSAKSNLGYEDIHCSDYFVGLFYEVTSTVVYSYW